jgi:hypothetical protein
MLFHRAEATSQCRRIWSTDSPSRLQRQHLSTIIMCLFLRLSKVRILPRAVIYCFPKAETPKRQQTNCFVLFFVFLALSPLPRNKKTKRNILNLFLTLDFLRNQMQHKWLQLHQAIQQMGRAMQHEKMMIIVPYKSFFIIIIILLKVVS